MSKPGLLVIAGPSCKMDLFLRSRSQPFRSFVRTLKLIESGDVTFKKPPPFDYMAKHFSMIKSMIDPTHARLNENSKVVVVEGNIASGKSALASKLAAHFGMVYFPDPTEDDIFTVNCCPPFDLRVHNALLPDSAKYYTTEMFWNEPDLINKGKPLYLQYQYYIQRYWNYLKALCNLFNTGAPLNDVMHDQAVVLLWIAVRSQSSHFLRHFINAVTCQIGVILSIYLWFFSL